VYIGSTTESLKRRLQKHTSHYNNNGNVTSKIMFDYGDVSIELIEHYECNNRLELTRREGEFQLQNKCVNKNIGGRPNEINCECGGKYKLNHKTRHLKTNKHISYQNTN
jgi:hypothetical protein